MRRTDDVRARRPGGPGLRPPATLSLARALSKLGVCSRREAQRWIADGRVRVNRATERSPSRWIDPARDRLFVDGRRVAETKAPVVLAFHKPAGLVTTRADPAGRPTVYDALEAVGQPAAADAPAGPGWVFPVGRLDRDTSGLLIFTNDHRLGERLTSPEHHVPKTYHARVRGLPDREAIRALREGLALDDGTLTRPARVRVLGTPRPRPAEPGSTWLEIVLTEGKNRQVRRMGAAVGHEVLELVRVRIGGLALGALAPGAWRELGPSEIRSLRSRSDRQ
ncbi:MAG TPA: pseudouridine synthase [Vicinamibacteria bacterium]|nr:pseudouridine synthase [Vicinamibacteria bacterium]